MKLRWHIFTTFCFSTLVFAFTFDIVLFFLCIVAGIFIDVDHVFDYYAKNKKISINLNELSHIPNPLLIFHGIEYFVLFIPLSSHIPTLLFPTLSYGIHLLMDILTNRNNVLNYFVVLRILRRSHKR